MAVPAWFSSSVYLSNKLDQLHEAGYTSYDPFTLQQTLTQAGFSGSEGLYTHFVYYGMKENVSPNSYFDPDFYFQAKAADYFGKSAAQVTQSEITFIKNAFSNAGLSAWEHYQKFGVTEKLDPSANFSTEKYLQAKLNLLQASDSATYGSWTTDDVAAAFKSAGYTPVTHYFKFGIDEGIAPEYAESHGGAQQDLTTGADDLTGTIGDAKVDDDGNLSFDQNYNDYFNAEVDTLQSEDKIDGLGGSDTLYARVNASSSETSTAGAGSIEPTVTNVETILFRSQIASGDTVNRYAPVSATIDADRISLADGQILTIGSDNSRADLAIEDVRHDSDHTVVRFADADPAVSYYVYFDPQHLKAQDASESGSLYIKIMDVVGASKNQPLLTQPYDGIKILYNGSTEISLTFRSDDINLYYGENATYDGLKTAFQHAIDDFVSANSMYEGVFAPVTLGSSFDATGILDGIPYSGTGSTVVIKTNVGTIDATSLLITSGETATSTRYHTEVTNDEFGDCPLIQVTVELDNVGRVVWGDANPDCLPDDVIKGSNAGDLQIGSMSMRSGIERMDVKVDEGSWLQGLYSTNNTLRMVTVEEKDINGDEIIGNLEKLTNQADGTRGQLYIGTWDGKLDLQGNGTTNLTWADRAHFLTAEENEEGVWSGLKDVAVFDAKPNDTVYQGEINIAAVITEDSYDKYFKYVDGQRGLEEANAPTSGYSEQFSYLLGDANDTINMSVVGDIATDVDFKLDINTRAGDDLVAFRYSDMTTNQGQNQKYLQNAVITTEDGKDTVWFYGQNSIKQYPPSAATEDDGSVIINTGADADVVYANQIDLFEGGTSGTAYSDGVLDGPEGYNAVYVFNATDTTIAVDGLDGARLNNNIATGQASFTYSAEYNAARSVYVTLAFKGFTVQEKLSDVTFSTSSSNTTISPSSVTAEDINHAIIKAVEGNFVLNHLLSAKDGAGHSLIIESLINGDMSESPVTIGFKMVDASGKTVVSGDDVFASESTSAIPWYTSAFGTDDDDDASPFSGNDFYATSQVIVDAGTGNDLIVLGPNGPVSTEGDTNGDTTEDTTGRDIIELNGSFGNDTVVGFEAGVDQINVSGLGISSTVSTSGTDATSLVNNQAMVVTGLEDKASGIFTSSQVAALIDADSPSLDFSSSASSGAKAVVLLHDTLGAKDVYTAVLLTNGSSSVDYSVMGSLTLDADSGPISNVDLVGVSELVDEPATALS